MSLPMTPGTYAIDQVHSQLGFAVKHLDISLVHGTFDRFSGALVVGASLAETMVTIDAEMDSINTGHPGRDDHVKNADFLDVTNHPKLSFRSTAITEKGNGYAMTGELTIKGLTHPVTLDVSYNGSAVFPPDKSTHFGFAALGTISRSAFGVSMGVPLVSDEVDLRFDVQFVLPPQG